MGRKDASIAVRHGATVAHVETVADAAELMALLNGSSANRNASDDGGLLDNASSVANEVLGLLTAPCGLVGNATKNLGTALRAKPVRAMLSDVCTAQRLNVLEELSFIADAADAKRHLTRQSIQETLSTLKSSCIAYAQSPAPFDPLDGPDAVAEPDDVDVSEAMLTDNSHLDSPCSWRDGLSDSTTALIEAVLNKKRSGASAATTSVAPAVASVTASSQCQLPPCLCGMPSRILTVTKVGPNTGRSFFHCDRPPSEQCGYFQWCAAVPS